ncbi:LacI family DNA-binding transcriptional regulator [Pedobacter sp. MC2016-15]|uniref:LacI family DNA-binding transcriptional regulator n=1 Tax=Pedobacter sp. MC2016-15 TaxID=2994473 RepID=UPI0022469D6B|nr:LacI family DNA-binding transcriptional regulator [Pedobacter sp. MC2016-15]MCX2480792.1 LacI family DNA-binding transcriptional regulator [Pedobacter sp. MC2016-15]
MFESSTIKDIARALNLSTSTVSRALRDSYEISAGTKKLVMDYAQQVNYRPNPNALSLKERRSKSIGIVVSEVANHYFSQAINGIESIANSRGYTVIITQTHESVERERTNVQHLASRSVDGLLISLSAETNDVSHLEQLHERGLPIVFFDRVPERINTYKVIADNAQGAYEATNHLIQSGFKKIAHISSSGHLSISIERLTGYTQALHENGLSINPEHIKNCPHGGMIQDEVETAVKELLSLQDKPDAIFVAGDRLTMGCMHVLKKLNMLNPTMIAIAGFSNSDVLDLFNPPITSVFQPAFDMGQLATEKLLELIEAKFPVTEFDREILHTRLYIR